MPFFNIQWSVLYLASEWIIRLTMLLYVPQRRSPSAARAWLLLIFFLPLPGIVLYALVGRIYVPRRRIALQRQASQLIRSVQERMPTPVDTATITLPGYVQAAVQLAARLGDFRAVAGNYIALLPGYEEPLTQLISDLSDARASIHLLYYIYENDATGRRITEVLC